MFEAVQVHWIIPQCLFCVPGLAAPGVIMICIQFAECNHTVIVAMLFLCLTCGGFTMGGFQVNHIDLSPNFAGKYNGGFRSVLIERFKSLLPTFTVNSSYT